MNNDRTSEVEERLKAIQIEKTDGCYFFSHKDGSAFRVIMCAFCHYEEFEGEKKSPFLVFNTLKFSLWGFSV